MSPLHTVIDWQGISLSVEFTSNRFGTSVHHLEIHVLQPEGAVIPITDTGYRSHFFSEPLETVAEVETYLRTWLDSAALASDWKRRQEAARQFSLF